LADGDLALAIVRDIVVQLPGRLFEKYGFGRLEEGIWRDAPVSGYVYRIDPENSGTRTLRHVHIAPRRNPAEQVSWNVDGTRHDRTATARTFTGMKQAKAIARAVLNLPDNVTLDEGSATDVFKGAMHLIESEGRGGDALDVEYLVARE
jgi:hypothetical protein